LTGDYDDNQSELLVLRLKHLQSRAGIYAVLGNHDIYTPVKEKVQAAGSIGIHVLWNEIAYPLGQELPLVGLLTIGRTSSK